MNLNMILIILMLENALKRHKLITRNCERDTHTNSWSEIFLAPRNRLIPTTSGLPVPSFSVTLLKIYEIEFNALIFSSSIHASNKQKFQKFPQQFSKNSNFYGIFQTIFKEFSKNLSRIFQNSKNVQFLWNFLRIF